MDIHYLATKESVILLAIENSVLSLRHSFHKMTDQLGRVSYLLGSNYNGQCTLSVPYTNWMWNTISKHESLIITYERLRNNEVVQKQHFQNSVACKSFNWYSCSFSSDQFPSFYRAYRFLVCKMAVPNSKNQDIMSIRMVTELTVDNIPCFVISWNLRVSVKVKCVTNDIPEHSLYACTDNIVQINRFRLYLNKNVTVNCISTC